MCKTIIQEINSYEKIVFDFEGIDVICNSFADEPV